MKTYSEMIQENRVVFPETVDEATKQLIYDWFQYREVSDEDRFPSMFNRELSISFRQYAQLLRIEPGQKILFEDDVVRTVTYDWLVQNYRESLIATQDSGIKAKTSNGTLSSTTTDGGSDTKIRTVVGQDVTDRDGTVNNTNTANITDTGSGTSHSETGTEDNSKSLNKTSPQSISYASAVAGGMPADLDWTYPGAQAESLDKGTQKSNATNSNTNTRSGTTTDSGRSTDDITFDTSRTTNETFTRGGTRMKSDINSGEESENHRNDAVEESIENGRNLDPATLLQNAKNFILGTTAWEFLYRRLDTCFQSVIMEW